MAAKKEKGANPFANSFTGFSTGQYIDSTDPQSIDFSSMGLDLDLPEEGQKSPESEEKTQEVDNDAITELPKPKKAEKPREKQPRAKAVKTEYSEGDFSRYIKPSKKKRICVNMSEANLEIIENYQKEIEKKVKAKVSKVDLINDIITMHREGAFSQEETIIENRRGIKKKIIDFKISEENDEYIRAMAKAVGIGVTAVVNQIITEFGKSSK